MKQKLNRGFTLIELLVVIAIIGILASVVLASLNTARDKGTNAANKSNLNNIRAQAEIVYDDNGDYDLVCADDNIVAAMAASGGTCLDSATAWAAAVDLVGSDTGTAYCVDSTGAAAENTVTAAAEADDTVCDGL